MPQSTKTIRIGPLSLFALIAMLFLSTLAVLSLTTANASFNLAQLQSDGMRQQYQAEDAAQRFLSMLDEQYASGSITAGAATAPASSGPSASAQDIVDNAVSNPTAPAATQGEATSPVDALAQEAAAATSGSVVGTAQMNGSTITAQFACPSGRVLDIEIQLGSGKSLHVVKWNMAAKVNNAEAETLWSGM